MYSFLENSFGVITSFDGFLILLEYNYINSSIHHWFNVHIDVPHW